MNRQRLFRGLRIAWTAVGGVLCIAMVVLWFKTSEKSQILWKHMDSGLRLYAVSAQHSLVHFAVSDRQPDGSWVVEYPTQSKERPTSFPWFGYRRTAMGTSLDFPWWSVVFVALMFAVAPWLPWKSNFSLRTLLIATTVVAVGLALIVYFARR